MVRAGILPFPGAGPGLINLNIRKAIIRFRRGGTKNHKADKSLNQPKHISGQNTGLTCGTVLFTCNLNLLIPGRTDRDESDPD